MNAQVLGISVDHIPSLKAWAESIGGIHYPLLSDFWPHGKVAKKYGVLRSEGYAERAIYVVDKQGLIRYIDIHDIDDQPNNEEVRKVLRDIDPGVVSSKTGINGAKTVALPEDGIVMYCTPWCPDCRKARKWLEARDLAYTFVDITVDHHLGEQVERWANGYRTTPTFVIDGEIVVDWDENRLLHTLEQKGYL